MTVEPTHDKLLIRMRSASSALTSDVKTEVADVLAVGSSAGAFKVGDVILLKAWAVDVISDGTEEHEFIDVTSSAICGTVTE